MIVQIYKISIWENSERISEIECKVYTDDVNQSIKDLKQMDFGFNVTYLIDVLNNIQYDKLNFAFKDSSSSCLVTIPNNEDYKYVVMPMRI